MHSLVMRCLLLVKSIKEDRTVGLEGVEDWYKKLCKALFFLIPH